MFIIFLALVTVGILFLAILAYMQYRRNSRFEIFQFDLNQLELTRALAWGGMMMIFVGLVLHYFFMWPIRSLDYAIAMGASFSLGMLIPIAREFLTRLRL